MFSKNILAIFRNSKLIGTCTIFYFVFSCTQHQIIKPQRFNFKDFNSFVESDLSFCEISFVHFSANSFIKNSNLKFELNQLQNDINNYYGTSIQIPEKRLLFIYSERDINNIKAYLENEKLINAKDFYLYDDFVYNSKTIGFESAMTIYEKEIIKRGLTESEFNHYNIVANALKIIENQNPSLFDNETFSTGILKDSRITNPWKCLLEYVFWVVSVILTFVACTGPQALFFCIAAGANLVRQTLSTAEACAGYL